MPANLLHLDPAHQSLALAMRRSTLDNSGAGRLVPYQTIATALGFASFDAAARACEAESVRQVGDRSLTVAFRHRARGIARRFGIEIEFNRGSGCWTQQQDIVRTLTTTGINAVVESYNHAVRSHWKMTTDATVTGGEIVSPIMNGTSASIDEVREVLRAVKAHGGSTGSNVGMHVHHDVTDFSHDQMRVLVANLRDAQSALAGYVPAARTNGSNMYGARRISDNGWVSLAAAVDNGSLLPVNLHRSAGNRNYGCPVSRYSFFNFNSVLTYGTVEFRGLGNTLNPIKVRTWVEVGQAVIEFSRRGFVFGGTVTAQSMVDELVARVGLNTVAAERFVAEVARRAGR
jgi:hypothetical protein